MFSNEDLICLDPAYFSIITTDAYDVTIMAGILAITDICTIRSIWSREQ